LSVNATFSSAKGISKFNVNRENNAAKETLVELSTFSKEYHKKDVHNVLYTPKMLIMRPLKISKPRPIPT